MGRIRLESVTFLGKKTGKNLFKTQNDGYKETVVGFSRVRESLCVWVENGAGEIVALNFQVRQGWSFEILFFFLFGYKI